MTTIHPDVQLLHDILEQRGWVVVHALQDEAFVNGMTNIYFSSLQELVAIAKNIGRGDAAVPLYSQWITLNKSNTPLLFAAWFNLGVELNGVGDNANALIAYKNALVLRPDCYQAAVNLGLQFEGQGNIPGALDIWGQALQANDARTTLLNHMGRVQENLKRYDEAEQALFSSLLTNPKQPDVIHHWVYLRQKMCMWPVFGCGVPGLSTDDLNHDMGPLSLLALIDDPATQDRYVSDWLDRKGIVSHPRLSPVEGYAHDRLRVAYMSSDYCNHPISFLMAELFERHDRAKFEVYGYCCSPEDGSDTRRRVIAAFDHFTRINAMSDEQLAHRIRADEIDILIDLNGLTANTRMFSLTWRPAPVQLTYLGYIGPIPLPEMDYVICDEFTVPSNSPVPYRPTPLRLPGLYQVNDTKLPVNPTTPRSAAGLPDDKFVFCCFSNNYKITEEIFDTWMTILERVDNSVMWLLADNVWAHQNMRARATAHGLDPNRLIFTERVSPPDYLGRLALADLFLDTFPYNAGTTASDALRMGLPVVTLSGKTFAARMAGSLLNAIGLDWGVTGSLSEYIDKAVEAATNPDKYREIRAVVSGDAWRRTIGNIEEFMPKLEKAYQEIAVRPGMDNRPAEKDAL